MKWIKLCDGEWLCGKTNQNKRCLKISAGLSFETRVGASAVRRNESFSPVSVKRPWIHLRWWGGGLMRADENPPRCSLHLSLRERVFLLVHLRPWITFKLVPAFARATRGWKKRPLLYCLYRDVWRGIQIIAPPYKDTQKNSPSKLLSAQCV